jgi:hypothetical protein
MFFGRKKDSEEKGKSNAKACCEEKSTLPASKPHNLIQTPEKGMTQKILPRLGLLWI